MDCIRLEMRQRQAIGNLKSAFSLELDSQANGVTYMSLDLLDVAEYRL